MSRSFLTHHFGTILKVTIAVIVIATPVVIWRRYGNDLIEREKYLLTLESLEIPAQPSWIRSDIRADVFREGSLAGVSILDKDAAVKVAQAFELHSWVAEVRMAEKRPGPRIHVELTYRQPLVMVKALNANAYWPVDTEGILLDPEDFATGQVKDYMRVFATGSDRAGLVGTAYGDVRITGAIQIAKVLKQDWKTLGVPHIFADWDQRLGISHPQATYQLVSQSGVTIYWGHAPGAELDGEATARQKLNRLLSYVAQNGPLESQANLSGLDLRDSLQLRTITTNSGIRPAGWPSR